MIIPRSIARSMISQPSGEKRSGGTTWTTTAIENGWAAKRPVPPSIMSNRSTTGSTVSADVKLTPVGFAVAAVTAKAVLRSSSSGSSMSRATSGRRP